MRWRRRRGRRRLMATLAPWLPLCLIPLLAGWWVAQRAGRGPSTADHCRRHMRRPAAAIVLDLHACPIQVSVSCRIHKGARRKPCMRPPWQHSLATHVELACVTKSASALEACQALIDVLIDDFVAAFQSCIAKRTAQRATARAGRRRRQRGQHVPDPEIKHVCRASRRSRTISA